MGKCSKQCVALLVLVTLILAVSSPTAFAQAAAEKEEDKAAKMVVDALVIRPLSLVATVAGTAVFIVALPFSALGGNVKASAEKLVVEPAKFTFVRPLGEF
jgi:ABC-type molybdate transport system permease subunit